MDTSMPRIIFKWACALVVVGFLFTSAESTDPSNSSQSEDTEHTHLPNSTLDTTYETTNLSNSDSNSTIRSKNATLNSLTTSVEESTEAANGTINFTEDFAGQDVEGHKNSLESQSVESIDLTNTSRTEYPTGKEHTTGKDEDSANMTSPSDKKVDSSPRPDGKSDDNSNGSEEDLSSNSKEESVTTESTSSVMLVRSENSSRETTSVSSAEDSSGNKSTAVKSTNKRSITEKNPNATSDLHVSNEAPEETTLSYTETASVNSEATSDNETGINTKNTTDNQSEYFNATTETEENIGSSSYNISGVEALVDEPKNESSVTADVHKTENSEAVMKDPRANRKRRLSTLETAKNVAVPGPTASIIYEDPDSVIDEPSSFDFPEHISAPDPEIWPQSFSPHIAHETMSASNDTSALSNDHGKKSTERINSQEDVSTAGHIISSEKSGHMLELKPTDISALSKAVEADKQYEIIQDGENLTSDIKQITSLKQSGRETEGVTSAEMLSTNSKETMSKEIAITSAMMENAASGVFTQRPVSDTRQKSDKSDSNITPTVIHEELNSESLSRTVADSAPNDTQMISDIQAALRQGILLEPAVFTSKYEISRNSTDQTNKEVDTGSETKIEGNGYLAENLTGILNREIDRSVTSSLKVNISEYKKSKNSAVFGTVPATKEVAHNQMSDSKNSSAMITSTTERPAKDFLPHTMLKDMMLSDSPTKKNSSDSPMFAVEYFNSAELENSSNDHKSHNSNNSPKMLVKDETSPSPSVDSVQYNTSQSVIRPVTVVNITADSPSIETESEGLESSHFGDVSSNKIANPQSTSVIFATETSTPATLHPMLQANASTDMTPSESITSEPQAITVSEDNSSISASSPTNNEVKARLENDVHENRTGYVLSEAENSTDVIAVPTASPAPVHKPTTTRRTGILKPKLRNQASPQDRPTPRSIIPTHRPRATTVGEPVSIFKKNKTRIGSITSSTTYSPMYRPSLHRVHYADRIPDGMIPLGPGVSLNFTSPAPSTEPPTTTTEEPYTEEIFTEVTQVPSVSSDDDVTLVKMAGTVVVKKGLRWKDQLYHRNSPQYKETATQMHLKLERLFRTSSIATRLWSIEIDGFSETYPSSRSVIVDFIISLIKFSDENEEKTLVTIFNDKLKNNTFSRYTVDPSLTEFKVLEEERRNKPTEAPGPEPPIPQWAIAVIVVGAASLIFIVLFATVTMYGRHHMRRRYSNKLNEEDLDRSGDWETKMAAAYENLAADTIYDAENGSIDSMKRSYLVE